MYNQKVDLIKTAITANTYGDPIETRTTSKTVYCRIVSADEKEKTLANSRGETAEYVVILPDKKMYDGERKVEFGNNSYKITDLKFTDTNREMRLVVGEEWQAH